jgi:hypothetical protein
MKLRLIKPSRLPMPVDNPVSKDNNSAK